MLLVIVQMVWFRENWYEELLRQLNEGLVMCQSTAFNSRADGKQCSQYKTKLEYDNNVHV